MKKVLKKNSLATIYLALTVLTSCQNPGQQAEEREKFGIKLFNQGDYKKAKLEFASALKGDGTLAQTYYYLALLNEKDGNYVSMRENLIQAIRFDKNNHDAQVRLGKLYLFFNDLEAANTQADEMLSISENNPDGSILKAAIHLKQKKQSDALTLLDKVILKQPNHVEAVSLKALVLIQNGQLDDALKLISPLLESGSNEESIHLLKIQIDSRQNNIDAVILDYKKLSKLHPERYEFKIALAKAYFQANKKQEASTLLKKLVKSTPNQLSPKLALLDLLHETNAKKIKKQIEEFSTEKSIHSESIFSINEWLLQRNYLPESKTLLNKIAKTSTNTKQKIQAKLLLAALALNESDFNKSLEIIDQTISINPENIQAKIIKAQVFIAQEKISNAESILTKVLWAQPNSDTALTLLAQIELIKGNSKAADQQFRKAIEVNPANMEALIPVINRLLANNDAPYASTLLSKAIKTNPNNLDLLKRAVEIKIAEKDWTGTDQLIESLEKNPDASLLTKLLKANIKQQQGEHSQAIMLFKEILSDSPNYPDVLRQMATSYEKMQKRAEMFSFISSFLEKNPTNITAHLVLGQIFVLDNKYQEAVKIYNKALVLNDTLPQIYAALARAHEFNNQSNQSVSAYKLGLEKSPNNIKLSIYLAAAFQKVKEYKNAEAIYESLLSVYPRLDIAINNYASLLVDTYGDKQSIEKAIKLAERFRNSEHPYYLDSYAWAVLKSDNVEDALPLLEKVNLLTDQVPVFKYHLAVAYNKQGNKAAAIAQLSQAMELGKQRGGFENSELAATLLEKLSMKKSLK